MEGKWAEVDPGSMYAKWQCTICGTLVSGPLENVYLFSCIHKKSLAELQILVSEPATGSTFADVQQPLLEGKHVRRPHWMWYLSLAFRGTILKIVDSTHGHDYPYHVIESDFTATDWEVVDGR